MKRALTAALALTVAFAFAVGMGASAAQANVALTQLSSDPFTNPTSQHATEVEPDTFAFGSTIVAAFQQGRLSAAVVRPGSAGPPRRMRGELGPRPAARDHDLRRQWPIRSSH